jgi:N4-gp56 family major capsid protein
MCKTERKITMNEFYINLQMFADNTTTSTGLAAEMPSEFWKNRLIAKAQAKLYHNQFGDTYDIPANNGKTVQMRLRNHYAKATSTLNEMDAGDGQLISVDEVTATVGLYGKYTKLSALLTWTSKDNLHASEQDELAYQAARSIDTLTRDVLVGGSNVYYAPSVATDGTATAITARANLTALCKLNTKLLFKVAALLGANDVPQFEGGYVGIIHPEAAFDIKTDTNFVDVVK